MRWLGAFLLLLVPSAQADDETPLGLADLEAYRVALASKPDASAPLVRFRDLWDRPGEFAGRPVAVEGKIARQFRQAKLGDFPPLVEAWVVSHSGDPFCLVFPPSGGRPTPEVGASVRFSGTFLRRIKYHGGDVERLAPLIVGPEPPSTPGGTLVLEGSEWSSIDWIMALGACLVIGLVLARRHLARPSRALPTVEPAPLFVDGKPAREEDFDEI